MSESQLIARCECGVVVSGDGEDGLVANVQQHVKDAHPGVSVTREHILAMAEMAPPEAGAGSTEGQEGE
jgi:predicted small metal-binding protein